MSRTIRVRQDLLLEKWANGSHSQLLGLQGSSWVLCQAQQEGSQNILSNFLVTGDVVAAHTP